jgi:hypothetical protein
MVSYSILDQRDSLTRVARSATRPPAENRSHSQPMGNQGAFSEAIPELLAAPERGWTLRPPATYCLVFPTAPFRTLDSLCPPPKCRRGDSPNCDAVPKALVRTVQSQFTGPGGSVPHFDQHFIITVLGTPFSTADLRRLASRMTAKFLRFPRIAFALPELGVASLSVDLRLWVHLVGRLGTSLEDWADVETKPIF